MSLACIRQNSKTSSPIKSGQQNRSPNHTKIIFRTLWLHSALSPKVILYIHTCRGTSKCSHRTPFTPGQFRCTDFAGLNHRHAKSNAFLRGLFTQTCDIARSNLPVMLHELLFQRWTICPYYFNGIAVITMIFWFRCKFYVRFRAIWRHIPCSQPWLCQKTSSTTLKSVCA